jgi:hypothetical protein
LVRAAENSIDDCADKSVMEILESTQERYTSVTAKFVKAVLLAKVLFAMSLNDPSLRVMQTVVDYHFFHRNVKLNFIDSKPQRSVEHLVSVIKPTTFKAVIESKLEMANSDLKKDFPKPVAYM